MSDAWSDLMRDERRVPTKIPTEELSVDDTSVGKGSDVEVLTTQIDAGTKEIIPLNRSHGQL